MAGAVVKLFKELAVNSCNHLLKVKQTNVVPVRWRNKHIFIEKPLIGVGKSFRRIIHYPEEYTVEPLNTTNLAGRDPVTGRRVVKGIGGGIKHKYHWIKWIRDGPTSGPPKLEKVIKILNCGNRTADVALVATGDELKYILATENMKPGDILKTSREVTKIPVRANEGDAYPVGSLPIGSIVHNVEIHTDDSVTTIHAAGCFGTIKRRIGKMIVIELPSKREMAVYEQCVATVGRLSKIKHGETPIGSASANRLLGNRPRSGLWQRKTGFHGRKIRPLPPPRLYVEKPPPPKEVLRLTHPEIRI